MKKEKRENDAVSILHRRYIGNDADRKASLQEERVNAEVARMIYDLRKGAGITQPAPHGFQGLLVDKQNPTIISAVVA